MDQSIFPVFLLRIMLSVIGILGNGVLIISILHLTNMKSFEVLLLGLAIANFGELMLVDIYDAIVQSMLTLNVYSCVALKFLNICGENASIFFTVIISTYRYWKMRKAAMRIIAPIFLDRRKAATGLSMGCFLVAALLALPAYFINQDTWHMENSTTKKCSADFFQCSKFHCPTLNNIYKYLFISICHVLPFITVTWTSFLIIKILIVQKKAVDVHHESAPGGVDRNHHHHRQHAVFHRSTIVILVAMAVFQVDCILYLILHLFFSSYSLPAWSELEFVITTFYTGVTPYIYGMGYNFFSVKHFMKKQSSIREISK